MNYSFLPEKLKSELKSIFTGRIPQAVVRTSGSLDGSSGEGYVILDKDRIYLYSRKIGQDVYEKLEGRIGAGALNLRKDKFNNFLDIDLAGKKYSVKLSGFEDREISSICDKLNIGNPTKASNEAAPLHESAMSSENAAGEGSSPKEVSASLLLAAGIMYVSTVDKGISEEEDAHVMMLFQNDRKFLQKALAFYKSHSYQEYLLLAGKTLNEAQKVCILANIIEMSMKDGVYQTSEQGMIDEFVSKMNIPAGKYRNIEEILLLKNNISILA